MDADAAIVVDDAAILNHVPAQALDRLFRLERGATILTEPTLPLIAPVMLEIDRGLCLTQTASHGVIAISPGDLDRLGHRLGAILATHRHIRRTGQSTHPLLSSRDGAPIVGRLDEAGPLLVGGFGSIGAFIAPAIARFIAGQSPAAEASYFAARAPSRPLMPSIVADYAPQPPMAETAA